MQLIGSPGLLGLSGARSTDHTGTSGAAPDSWVVVVHGSWNDSWWAQGGSSCVRTGPCGS